MADPIYLLNSRGQSVDSIIKPDGTVLFKLAVGTKALSGYASGAWQGVATHTDASTFAASDGVVVVAGLDGTTVRKMVVDANGNLVASVKPSSGNLTDRSGAITTGATAQQLAAANTARKYLLIQNLDSGEDLWINFTTTAVADRPSIRIPPDGTFVMEGSFVSTELVSVIAATTGHEWTAKEA